MIRTKPNVRWKALCALKQIDTDLTAALPVVVPHLHDANRLCRREAAQLIAEIGPNANAAVPELIQSLEDEDEEVQPLAFKALCRIGLGPEDIVDDCPFGKTTLEEGVLCEGFEHC